MFYPVQQIGDAPGQAGYDDEISFSAREIGFSNKTPSDLPSPLRCRIMSYQFDVRSNGYAVGVRKGDDTLRLAVNAWIEKDLANGKLRSAYKQFHGLDLPADMPKK